MKSNVITCLSPFLSSNLGAQSLLMGWFPAKMVVARCSSISSRRAALDLEERLAFIVDDRREEARTAEIVRIRNAVNKLLVFDFNKWKEEAAIEPWEMAVIELLQLFLRRSLWPANFLRQLLLDSSNWDTAWNLHWNRFILGVNFGHDRPAHGSCLNRRLWTLRVILT